MIVSIRRVGLLAFLALLAASCARTAPPPPPTPPVLVLADFNTGRAPNNVGGCYGAWMRDEEDPAQFCRLSGISRDSGYVLRLDYDVEDSKPAFNGFWMKLQNLDASSYDDLVLSLGGDNEAGFTSLVKLELKSPLKTGSFKISGISPSMREFRVPLRHFQGLDTAALSGLTEFGIVFADIEATRKTGTLYLDNIRLERTAR